MQTDAKRRPQALSPRVQSYRGSVLPHLYETDVARIAWEATQSPPHMTLGGIRNSLAPGDPFDGLLWGELLELVRDIFE